MTKIVVINGVIGMQWKGLLNQLVTTHFDG